MTIEQLQYFYAICEYKTFSSAALEMNITQSSLSKQIAKLEQELGVNLFDRHHRQICLTYEGEQLLNDIKTILKDYYFMIDHLKILKQKHKNTIKIAMLPIMSQCDLSGIFHSFMNQNPDIHLFIDEIEERDIFHKLDFLDYDIYIIRGQYQELENYNSFVLLKDYLTAVVSNKHPLANQQTLSINDLKSQQLLLLPSYTSICHIAIEACKKHGFHPQITRYGRLETIISSASYNHGIALVMGHSLNIFQLNNVKTMPLTENIEGNLYFYYRSQSNCKDTILKLVNHVQSFIKEE